MTTETENPKQVDYTELMARKYWRQTEHVFMSAGSIRQTPDGPTIHNPPWCRLCAWIEDFGPHGARSGSTTSAPGVNPDDI